MDYTGHLTHGMGHNACACMQDGVFMDFFSRDRIWAKWGLMRVSTLGVFFFLGQGCPMQAWSFFDFDFVLLWVLAQASRQVKLLNNWMCFF